MALPANLANLMAFLDATSHKICRPDGPGAIQNAFWNGYYHGHFLIWMGLTFPDGMIVLEGPISGFNTDPMIWRDGQLRVLLEAEMNIRQAQGLPRYKLYADKIFNTCALITATWNLRHGHLAQWMIMENSVMSTIRIAIEWGFGLLKSLYKFMTFYKGQKLQESPIEKHFVISTLLCNCHTCLYGDRHNEQSSFDIDPPTLEDYLGQ